MSAPVNPPGLKPFGWAFDFLDGVRVVKDWTTSKKADAFHPNHFNQRPVFIGPHTGAEAHPEAPVPEWDNKAYMQAIALLRVKFGISHAFAELNKREAANSRTGVLCPWPDYIGTPIRHGDRLSHPDGTEFVAVYLNGYDTAEDSWRAVYDAGPVSRLCLQIGDKGQAVLITHPGQSPT